MTKPIRRYRGVVVDARSAADTDTMQTLSRDLGSCVYFIHTTDHLIKIGWSCNLAQRRRVFGTWGQVLLIRQGTYEDEQALHQHFAPFRAKGREYYKPARSLMEYINEGRVVMGIKAIPLPPRAP